MYIKENDNATLKFYKGRCFLVEPPNFVILLVTESEPGVKGDTATGGTKPATLESGLTVTVPLFIAEGDSVKVNTDTGEYMERVTL